MTPEDRKYLRNLQIKADFEDDIPSHGTLGAQWITDEISQAQQQDACYIERLARKDFEPARFANLRNGGGAWKHPPRAKPGRIRLWIGNAIGLACIIVIALAFYVVTP